MIKYKNITEKALASGEIKFTLAPISLKKGKLLNTFPNNKNKGDPGGCGTPRI